MRTVSMTWMTPFDWKTSAVVMVAVPPLASSLSLSFVVLDF